MLSPFLTVSFVLASSSLSLSLSLSKYLRSSRTEVYFKQQSTDLAGLCPQPLQLFDRETVYYTG